MGMNLGDIFKKDEETLVIDRKKEAIKGLLIFTGVVFIILVILLILRNSGDADEDRRNSITKDIQNIRNYVVNKATELKENPDVTAPGTSLREQPYTLVINGVQEEYRYGYYLLTSNDLQDMSTALNLPNEQYIVNYDTGDVINVTGIKYGNGRYHSIDDLLAIENNQPIPSANTIIIKLPSDMVYLQQNPGYNFKLAGNIDMSAYAAGEGWDPVSNFTGKFDGRGYIISNLTIERPSESYVGLFGRISSGATVTNLELADVHVTGEDYTGALAGVNAGTISHVIINGGDVKGELKTGGIVGSHQQGNISNCKADLNSVSGTESVGGFVGELSSGTIQESVVLANISALRSVGGFAGSVSATNATYLTECLANTTITGTESLGGLVGKIEILANSKLELFNSYAIGTISEGTEHMGGIAGYVRTAGAEINFKSLYASVNVLVKNATSGGCIGTSIISTLSPCSVSDVFWEKNLAVGEELYSVGTTSENTIKLNFTDKTSEEMRTRSTFSNWDFDVWGIEDHVNMPYLKIEKNFESTVSETVTEK